MSPRTLQTRYDAGAPLSSFTTEERAELRKLIVQSAAYQDPKNQDHHILIADAKQLYAEDFPEADQ